MRNVPLADVDGVPRDVLPIGTDYPPDHRLPRHTHRRAQLLHADVGVMVVEADAGSWTVPVGRAVLIPAGTPHEVRMLGVSTMSLYVEPAAVPWWPEQCAVVEVSPLLRALISTSMDFPADYDDRGRAGKVIRLLLGELADAAPLPLSITLPPPGPLRDCCTDYLADPTVGVTNTTWARRCGLAARTLDREFRRSTGTSAAAWRVRARLLAAVPMLATANVTEVSGRLGYSSPAAFTAAFSHAFGVPPSVHRTRTRS